ncbi:electron transfer flavoprotein subunit beta/FixA family protein [candidate division WOR-3 bacterium]|nr:electron transfer flavoprotein subunit beta/FixA family protein [candidate division WOR-3 bacterium]
MHIIVCLKQVPDISESPEIKINPETNTLIREGVPSIINPFDMYAIEEGLRIKEKMGGRVTAISMGPPQAKEVLEEAISMGIDKAVLISDKSFAGADTLATSYTLAMAIKKIGNFDLILCGKQAIDGDTAQVGPELAEILSIPVVTLVKKIEEINPASVSPSRGVSQYARTGGYAKVERLVEQGFEIIETSLPALFTVVKEINEPRLPTLRGKLKAKSAEILTWKINDLNVKEESVGLNGSPTQVMCIFAPEQKKQGEIFTGSVPESVEKITSFLKIYINHK